MHPIASEPDRTRPHSIDNLARLAAGSALRDNGRPATDRAATTMRTPTTPSTPTAACPCGWPLPYAACCGRYHAGDPAPTAEALMRSRYSAYVLGLEAYLRATWHATTRPDPQTPLCDPATRWQGLEIRDCGAERSDGNDVAGADDAYVEFVARYKVGGRAFRLHEKSRFVRANSSWYYVDGQFVDSARGQRSQRRPRFSAR